MIAEAIFTVGAVLFTISLLPTLFSDEAYVPRKTSALTAVVLTAYVYAFFSIGQYYSAGTGALTALAWWGIFWLRGNAPVVPE